ncbi:MAG: hypothetical protein ABIP78_11000 [Pyrinomonadaceae bacterium]
MDANSIQTKYGDLHDSEISTATARTLELVDLLREHPSALESIDIVEDGAEVAEAKVLAPVAAVKKKKVPKIQRIRSQFFDNIADKAS